MAFLSEEHSLQTSLRGKYSSVMSKLYCELDRIPLPEHIEAPEQLKSMVELVYLGVGQDPPNWRSSLPIPQTSIHAQENRVLVGFSGGKDSLAAAIQCKNIGLDPILFHVDGINRGYSIESDFAYLAAQKSGFDFSVEVVRGHKKSSFKENPVKDQLILAMMLDFGVRVGVKNYTMGIENTNKMAESNIQYNWSDSVEMFEAFNSWVLSGFSAYNWFWCIKNHSQSYRTIHDYNLDLLWSTTSCLMPTRFRDMRQHQTEKRFGVDVEEGRCGMCWKCCVEYLNLLALHAISAEKINPEYARYCFERFHEKLPEAYGERYKPGAPVEEVLKSAVDPEFVDYEYVRQLVL